MGKKNFKKIKKQIPYIYRHFALIARKNEEITLGKVKLLKHLAFY